MPKPAQQYNRLSKAFTLIEILIVVGILGVLAVAALVAINPGETQKKTRDLQRIKDLGTIQTVMEGYLDANPSATFANVNSQNNGGSVLCSSSWISTTVNFCPYTSTVPKDPVAGRLSKYVTSTGISSGNDTLNYYFRWSNGTYKICTFLESLANQSKVANDGGNDNDYFEVFSDPSIACP